MSCVTCNTPNKFAPFIDQIGQGVYLATGGCGEGATSCDEIGRIAAKLAVDQIWESAIPREACRAKLHNL
jgi:glycine/D-amino acid oxidase-like deaminating enzyme